MAKTKENTKTANQKTDSVEQILCVLDGDAPGNERPNTSAMNYHSQSKVDIPEVPESAKYPYQGTRDLESQHCDHDC